MTSQSQTTLQCITTIEDFKALETGWEQLTTEPLRSFAWNFAWWNNFQHLGELSILVLQCEGKTVGIAPFFQDRWNRQKRLRFLGSGKTCTDYASLIVDEGWRPCFSNEIAKYASETAAMLEMEGVDGTVPQDFLDQPMENQFWRYETDLDATWQLELTENWAEFIANSKKSLKRKIKRAEKRLSSDEFEIRSSLQDLPFEEAWEHIVRLHQSRFESKGEPGAFKDKHFRTFLREAIETLSNQGRAEIIVAFHDGEPFGAHLLLHEKQKTLLYLAGILAEKSKLEPGHLLIMFAVRRAIEQQRMLFDFLRGDQPYKSYWGAVPNQLQSIRFVSRSAVPTLLNQSFRLLRQLKHQYAHVKENYSLHAT